MLEDLLRVKRLREDNAMAAVRAAKRELARCEEARDEQQRAADDFRARRPAMEDALYDDLTQRLAELKDVHDVRDQVGALRAREAQLYEEVRRLEGEVDKARDAVAQAERERLLAHKAVEKFEEFQAVLLAEAQAEAERKEEVDLEDALTGRYSPGRESGIGLS